jgi:hypothetical protein
MMGDHGGGRGANLNPPISMPQPALCLAYRDNVSRDGDTCEVREPKYSWEEDWPWIIDAAWASCPTHDFGGCHNNDYPEPYESRVVAFDGLGRPVAWWDGQAAEDTQYVTE